MALAIFILLVLVIIITAIVELARRPRRMQQQALLGTLAATVDRGIPLIHTLDAYVHETGGVYGARVAEFSRLLKEGMIVPRALFVQRKVFPQSVLPLLYFGFATGTPGKALRQALQTQKARPQDAALGARLFYLGLFVFMAIGIITFLCTRIAPSFERIFLEFGIQLPDVTISFINFAHLSMSPFLGWVSFYSCSSWAFITCCGISARLLGLSPASAG
jgi:type II secretory pathway component PulF